MKVGDHAGETFAEIVARKQREAEEAGMIFWGYGGSACHPLTQVQPFVRTYLRQEGGIYLLMEPVCSRAAPDVLPAEEYSEDGVNWNSIPEGIEVTGSRYALVLSEILPGDLELDPSEFEVGIGPSRGKSSLDYISGRTDKACLVRSTNHQTAKGIATRDIRYTAKLADPFAVLLR